MLRRCRIQAASVHHPQLRHRGIDVGNRPSGAAVYDDVQTNAVTKHRMDLYRMTLREKGWTRRRWRGWWTIAGVAHVFVAETDAEAERIGVPLFQEMQKQRAAMRERVFQEQGLRLQSHAPGPTRRPRGR